ncbi:hypothetical protein D3C72_2203040 [compost metagenome]
MQATQRGTLAHTDIGKRHGDKEQLGENQYQHPQASRHGQVTDHWNINDHQNSKAHHIGDQRCQAGDEQTAKRVARGDIAVRPTADVLHDAVHLLRAMAKADGENQKRHQH